MWANCLIVMVMLFTCGEAAIQKKNVLFLVVDDLRPSLGAYSGKYSPSRSDPKMFTPNIDRLAKRSLLLQRSYVAQAICSPSRTSVLTGRRPDTTRVWDLKTYWRKSGGNFTTLPQYFKENGYRTIGMGKIFHPGKKASGKDDPISWSDPYFHGWDNYRTDHILWQSVNKSQEKINPLIDTQLVKHAVKSLRSAAADSLNNKQPFFIAVGFHKPHSPWDYPERFEKYYPLNDLKLPYNDFAPWYMPFVAWHNFTRLGQYKNTLPLHLHDVGAINYTFPDNLTLLIRRAYFSSVSFTDYNIGQVLDELDSLGLTNSTIVSFWGDHGFQLGEHSEWQKETNFELATRSPMIISVPGVTDEGLTSSALIESVDLYPTLSELAGLPEVKLCPENSTYVLVCTEGKSFVSLFKVPDWPHWKKAAFSQFPHGGKGMNEKDFMGYSMRTDRFRYTEWVKFKPKMQPQWHKLKGVELYDHSIDPDENVNRINYSSYLDIRKQLSKQLRAGWRYAS